MSSSLIEIYGLICNNYLGLFLQTLIKRKKLKRQPKIKQNIRGIFLTITFSHHLNKFLSDVLLYFSSCLVLLLYHSTGVKDLDFNFFINELIFKIIFFIIIHLFCDIWFWDKIKLAKNKKIFYVEILFLFILEINFSDFAQIYHKCCW